MGSWSSMRLTTSQYGVFASRWMPPSGSNAAKVKRPPPDEPKGVAGASWVVAKLSTRV
jgi:hypothetical protein